MTPTPDRATTKKALGIAREVALTLAKGPAATGFIVTKKGVSTVRARRADRRSTTPTALVSSPGAGRERSRGRRFSTVLVVALALAAGAVAFSRARRTELPPPAAEPPRLGAPSTNGHASPTVDVVTDRS